MGAAACAKRVDRLDDWESGDSQGVPVILAEGEATRAAILVDLDSVDTGFGEGVFDQRILIVVIAVVVEGDRLAIGIDQNHAGLHCRAMFHGSQIEQPALALFDVEVVEIGVGGAVEVSVDLGG